MKQLYTKKYFLARVFTEIVVTIFLLIFYAICT